MEKFGFSEEKIAQMQHVFELFGQIEQVIIYGSRAKGNFSPFSDVDITLKGSELTSELLTKVIMQIDELLLPYNFDISIYDKIRNPDVVEHINRIGQVLYKRM